MNNNISRDVLITVYSHPEFYPPTLNLINELSKKFDRVVVLSRNVFESNWIYPENTIIHVSGRKTTIRESENTSTLKKVFSFMEYTWSLLKIIIGNKPEMLVICDPIPTLAYKIINPFSFQKIQLWYHNHDILEVEKVKKYSISWFAHYSEKQIFSKLSLFTLPAEDRKRFFPIKKFKGNYFLLPNYPRISFFAQFKKVEQNMNEIRLLFQGSIGPNHGLEEIVQILDDQINKKSLKLVLKGFCSIEFKNKLLNLAEQNGVTDKIEFHGITSYVEVPVLMSTCQIGIAIHKGQDVMNSTLGTSSNKIYEYAAMGLPVILFDNEHFRKYLSNYKWCSFTDASPEDLIQVISTIDSNYNVMSSQAAITIEHELNYEIEFNKISF
jgi:glycosyltransferase involved in cell wall biosynthesis